MIQIRVFQKCRKSIAMILVTAIIVLCVIFGAAGIQMAKSSKGMTCSDLATLTFPNVTITSTTVVAATSTMPEYCKVAATLTPRTDSSINMQLWLPTTTWNGYYMTAGNSGWAGSIQTSDLIDGVQHGFASANTDTGHTGGAGTWVLVKDKLIDYGGRAIHETTVLSKKITEKFYGRKPEASFMKGCSLGGGQTMKAIQDYPNDFDAVVAGSPHMFMSIFNDFQVWPSWLINKDPEKLISKADYTWIREKVMDQCDGNIDGLKDGIVDDPLTCDFDPHSLVCADGQTSECLTEKQAEFLSQIYEGPRFQDTGELIYPGFTYGNETYWWTFVQNVQYLFFFDMHRWLYYAVKNNISDPSSFTIPDLTYTDDVRWLEDNMSSIVDAYNPDLRPFFKHGGKLLMWMGSEEAENYSAHLNYLVDVHNIVGDKVFDKSVRIFVVPGMHHCGGGDSCADTFDKLGAIIDWHETGEAPNVLEASKVVNSVTTFTRPLCAYPTWARYNGTGDVTLAENFSCLPVKNPIWPKAKIERRHHDRDHHDGDKDRR